MNKYADHCFTTVTLAALMLFPVTAPWYSIKSPTFITSLVVHSPQVNTCPDERCAPLGMSFSTETVPEIVG